MLVVCILYSEWPEVSNQAAKICVRYQSVVSKIWAHTSNIWSFWLFMDFIKQLH